MAFVFMDSLLGFPKVDQITAVADLDMPLGTILKGYDRTLGFGEFILLKGVASTVVGSWVTFNADDYTTALLAANAVGPVAIAMSANTAATDAAWYQITGKAQALLAASTAENSALYIDGTSGIADDDTVAGDRIWNAISASAATTVAGALSEIEIQRPFVNNVPD